MSRTILLVGALALAVAGTTTVAFRTTGTGTGARPTAAGPLAEHLREMREEMRCPRRAVGKLSELLRKT
jgi:hypothetical protein